MQRTLRLVRQLCSIALFLAFGLAQAESLVCTEEQRLELVTEHRAELSAATTDAPGAPAMHCCPCVHTFVSTARRFVVSLPVPMSSTRFAFLEQAPPEVTAAPLVPPPIA